MAEQKIIVESGVSWLYDHMKGRLEKRKTALLEGMANGVPEADYKMFVGKYKECRRQIDELAEIFAEFYRSSDEDDLEEIPENE